MTDASVAVKWFVEEADTAQAVKLKGLFENGEVELEAPSLLTYEVVSALRYHPKIRFSVKQFLGAIEVLSGLQITREPNEAVWSAAVRLSLENAISIYDAAYLAFAVCEGAKMVTADSSFVRNLKSEDIRQSVVLLSELGV